MQESKQVGRDPIFLQMTREDFLRFSILPVAEPIQMINLLKFIDRTEDGMSGSDKYDAYLQTAKPFFGDVEMKIL